MIRIVRDPGEAEVKFDCTKCGECCVGTSMELLAEDAERISKLGHKLEDFAVRGGDGVWRLRNVDGHCVFYDPAGKRCTIYRDRPLGCRLYPLNYDDDEGPVVDKACPAWMTVPPSEKARLARVLRLFVEETQRADDEIRLLRLMGRL